QVLSFSRRRYRILGETLDLALGNCLDRLARLLRVGLGPAPGGHAHCRRGPRPLPSLPCRSPTSPAQATTWSSWPRAPDWLISVTKEPPWAGRGPQETSFAMLTEVTERALALTGATQLLLVGGVAC
ncbi:KAE1 threonylcarbamoyltransferase, partial [Ramphastos sulfuratus]|nr:KAE1 threonylcarbamoyltransferase [Ramphastos sulfuratus]